MKKIKLIHITFIFLIIFDILLYINYLNKNSKNLSKKLENDNTINTNKNDFFNNHGKMKENDIPKSIVDNSEQSNNIINNEELEVEEEIKEKDKNSDEIIKEKTENSNKSITEIDNNKKLAAQIYNNFGIKVRYGDEAICNIPNKNCSVINDENAINKTLVGINNAFQKFPTNFLRQLKNNNGYSIDIFSEVPYEAVALTTYIKNNNRILIMTNLHNTEEVVFHETWHVIEEYINIITNNNEFKDWNINFNPENYVYGDTNNLNYIIGYDKLSEPKNLSFINRYSKYNEREDRAEIFKTMMIETTKPYYFNEGYGINNKVKYISNSIKKYFKNINNPIWDKFIQ